MKKLDTYKDALRDTPKNRKFQMIVDKINLLLPDYIKVYGFQDNDRRNPRFVTFIALAFKGCPKHLIGGDKLAEKMQTSDKSTYSERVPKGAISNYLGLGMFGEVASGYSAVEDELFDLLARLNKDGKKVWEGK